MKIRIKKWVLVDKERIIELEGLVTELENQLRILEKSSNDKCWEILCQASETAKQRDIAVMEVEKLNKKLDQLKEKSKAEKKELKDKIKELEKELDKRYIVKKIRASKPTKQTMNMKSSVKQSNAIKLVKEKL